MKIKWLEHLPPRVIPASKETNGLGPISRARSATAALVFSLLYRKSAKTVTVASMHL